MNDVQAPKRRKGPDFLVRFVQWVGGLSWLILLTALAFLEKAEPEKIPFFARIEHKEYRTWWDLTLAQYFFYIMILLFLLCVFTLIVNTRRLKRKHDRLNISVIVIGLASLIGFILYLIYF